ncbi:MAG: hypothetical protein ACM34J_12010 [Ignavibacteria bacterium]
MICRLPWNQQTTQFHGWNLQQNAIFTETDAIAKMKVMVINPDITVWNGQLVWSCRMEEQLNFGHNLRSYPKNFMS